MAPSFRSGSGSTPRLALLLLSLLISLLYDVHCKTISNDQPLASYKVGVYEHVVIITRNVVSRELALEAMQKNIDVYNETVIEARSKGVKLLVFPEYGIYGANLDRGRLSLFAETIPDPKSSRIYPCEDSEFKGQGTEIQRILSCIARDNEMFLVVNMAGRETCDHEADCPSDGQYFYNTNVVFSPKGQLVARYYKTHLFGENFFDPAKSAEAAIFDTPFGKFATFICFDVVFKKPAIELIEKHNIRNIAFSTAWVKIPPIFRSIQIHPSFAREAKVNLLAATRHLPPVSFGSGIYTPNGSVAYYYRPNANVNKLVVADIYPIIDVKPDTMIEKQFDLSQDIKTINDNAFNVSVGGSPFNFKHLKTPSGSVIVCHKSFCCKASYAIRGQFQDKYALGVYNGYVSLFDNKLYIQVCTLLKCPQLKCGREITSANTIFSNITLQGAGFSSKYVLPTILAMDGDQYELTPDAWIYSEEEGIKTLPGMNVTLHSATFIGRVYSKDVLVGDTQNHQNTLNKKSMTESFIYMLYFVAACVFMNF